MIEVRIIAAPFAPDAETARFAAARARDVGALASFVGYCRGEGSVTGLELDQYPGFTEAEVRRAAEHVAAQHGVRDALVIHRVGAIAAGEAIVLVAAMSPHRAAAFAAVSDIMDRLKTDAPIWKRELSADGARWIEPTAADHARRAQQDESR